MALGSVRARAPFLTIAGGYIWDRKQGPENPDYAVQKYTKQNGDEAERKGARYENVSGEIVGVQFRDHAQFGESINIRVQDGEDAYVISITTNNKISQDMMRFLLLRKGNKFFVKPYDFINENNQRQQGLSFFQDGAKIDLKKVDGVPFKDKDFFKSASKKEKKRFFEDLNDWFVEEVKEKVLPDFAGAEQSAPASKPATPPPAKEEETVEEAPAPTTKKPTKVTNLQKKRVIKAFIAENYPDNSMPSLSGDELDEWYKLAVAEEELPFEEAESNDVDNSESVSDEDLENQLNALM